MFGIQRVISTDGCFVPTEGCIVIQIILEILLCVVYVCIVVRELGVVQMICVVRWLVVVMA
jgi:hypothetical protein